MPAGLDQAASDIWLVNPLPVALHHYERELLDVLGTCEGLSARSDDSVTVEMSDGEAPSRPRRAAATLRARSRRGSPGARLVLWPVFGLADIATWWRYRPGTWVVVHDPKPLRRQVGMGRIGALIGGVASRHEVGVIVHSTPAQDVLTAKRWNTVVLPHPINDRTLRRAPPGADSRFWASGSRPVRSSRCAGSRRRGSGATVATWSGVAGRTSPAGRSTAGSSARRS